MPSKLTQTQLAIGKAKSAPIRSELRNLAKRAELALAKGDKKVATDCLAALASAAINFPRIISKRAAIDIIVGVLADAKESRISLRRRGIGWDADRACNTSGSRRCFSKKGSTCYEDSTGCISTTGPVNQILVAARVRALNKH